LEVLNFIIGHDTYFRLLWSLLKLPQFEGLTHSLCPVDPLSLHPVLGVFTGCNCDKTNAANCLRGATVCFVKGCNGSLMEKTAATAALENA
jgi:hypothetical protein